MPVYDGSTVRGYLDRLGIGMAITERIESLIQEYRIYTDTTPEFIFVENPINNVGSVEFSNLILLTGKMYADCSLNNSNNTVIFLNIPNSINRIVMPTPQELPFTQFSSRSRLTVQIFKGMETIGYFHASGNNCSELLEMMKRYFIPAITG